MVRFKLVLVTVFLAMTGSASAQVTLLEHHAAVRAQITTLVAATGQPVGGQMQRWVNESAMPSFAGAVVLVSPTSLCVAGAASCTARLVLGALPELAATDRRGLYFELGHLFDWHYLAPSDRAWLARQWQDIGVPWTDSNLSIEQGTEDGLEGAFAAIYSECAFDRRADISGIMLNEPPSATALPASAQPRSSRSTCAFIERASKGSTSDMRGRR